MNPKPKLNHYLCLNIFKQTHIVAVIKMAEILLFYLSYTYELPYTYSQHEITE